MAILNPEKQKKAAGRLEGYTAEYSNLTKECKAMALARRARSPVQVEETLNLLERLAEYEEDTLQQGKPLTMAGYILATGLSSDTFYKVLNGEYDYIIEEYCILHDVPMDAQTIIVDDDEIPLIPWSSILQKCRLRIQQQLEENCYTNRGNPAGSIFGLKAQHNWKEEAAPATVNNTLVIADAEQARKALKALE